MVLPLFCLVVAELACASDRDKSVEDTACPYGEASEDEETTAAGFADLDYAEGRLLRVDRSDSAGKDVAQVGDVNGDGRDDLFVASPGAAGGSTYLVHGPARGERSLSDAEAWLVGDESPADGWAVETSIGAAGDLNSDGFADMLVGTPETFAGVVFLVLAPVTGTLYLGDADAILVGEVAFDYAGTSLVGLGDVNDDGWADLLVGAPYAEGSSVESDEGDCAEEFSGPEPGVAAGVSYVVHGAVSGTTSLSTAAARLVGEDDYDYAGYVVAAPGDVDGDGVPDVALSAIAACDGFEDSGSVYLVSGSAIGDVSLADADSELVGDQYWGHAGEALAGAGDVNGDGLPDLMIGSPDWERSPAVSQGRMYLVSSPAPSRMSLDDSNAWFDGELNFDDAGASVSTMGDLDADGFADLAVGAPGVSSFGEPYGGAIYILFGPVTGGHGLGEADRVIAGATGLAGYSLSGGGDVDADGQPDLLLGTPGDATVAAYLVDGSGCLLAGLY